MKDLVIGPSTGWLNAQGMTDLNQQEAFFTRAGVQGVEITAGHLKPVFETPGIKDFLSLNRLFVSSAGIHRSLHLADFSVDVDVEQQVQLAVRLSRLLEAHYAVIHPMRVLSSSSFCYPVAYYRQLLTNEISLAIENMDRRKPSGVDLDELVGLKEQLPGLGFVLDVQHAYEHDPEMGYAQELLGAMERELRYLHVSGQTEDHPHVRLCCADNTAPILSFVADVLAHKPVPIILEGEYRTVEELQEEMVFVTSELVSL